MIHVHLFYDKIKFFIEDKLTFQNSTDCLDCIVVVILNTVTGFISFKCQEAHYLDWLRYIFFYIF
jgi:hypothetical protein